MLFAYSSHCQSAIAMAATKTTAIPAITLPFPIVCHKFILSSVFIDVGINLDMISIVFNIVLSSSRSLLNQIWNLNYTFFI